MVNSFITVLLFQLLGEAVVFVLGVSIPGPVVGMVCLFLWLAANDAEHHPLIGFSAAFMRHLSLLFIPAAVGIMLHLDQLASEWLAIVVAILLSTLASIIVTACFVRGGDQHE